MKRRTFIASGLAASTVGLQSANAGQSVLTVPPEESPHQATFMQWPVSRKVYRDRYFLRMVQQTIADIANTISNFEPVIMLADASDHAGARRKLSANVELWDIPTEDLWCRDSGPLFAVQDGGLVVSHIQFNGWGKKQIHTRDSQIALRVAERLGIPMQPSGLVGEAGGVEHDGHGLLMAHASSWEIDNRNPDMSRSAIGKDLLAAYGAERIIWADGLKGQDITDYHIDSLARFTGPGRVLINLPKNPDPYDPFHKSALETHAQLNGAGLDVEVIPEPVERRVKSIDFVASYANYYACNGAIIAAQFGDSETDKVAQDTLQKHYPDREIVTLNVDHLGELGGGIHCATQQMPAA
ncbi:MAG: agmatine deiminase family protein [Paracoccaceae bacterium]|nr:agmatine deiminase family protein [Paracoccaceae bacterium]